MTEYIKKNVLLEAIALIKPDASEYDTENPDNKTLQDIAYSAAQNMYDDVRDVTEGATPADVVPVIHAHWKKVVSRHCYHYKCSHCGGKIGYDQWDNERFSSWCPSCGAKMDESEDNNDRS